jgi:hypothetical protein
LLFHFYFLSFIFLCPWLLFVSLFPCLEHCFAQHTLLDDFADRTHTLTFSTGLCLCLLAYGKERPLTLLLFLFSHTNRNKNKGGRPMDRTSEKKALGFFAIVYQKKQTSHHQPLLSPFVATIIICHQN